MLQNLVLLALAGALGTLARYGLSGTVQRFLGESFPWGTATVNIAGCFLAGLLWSLCEHRWPVSSEVRTLVFVGFLGAFTTFSTLVLESSNLMRSSEWMYAAMNLAMQIGLGFCALLAGAAIGRLP